MLPLALPLVAVAIALFGVTRGLDLFFPPHSSHPQVPALPAVPTIILDPEATPRIPFDEYRPRGYFGDPIP